MELPSLKAIERGAVRLGRTDLSDVLLPSVVKKYGEQMATAEALLHEAAHYRVAGGALVEFYLTRVDDGTAFGKTHEEPRRCRVTRRMFDRRVTERLEELSYFMTDADEIEACAVVQLAGVRLGFWSNPALNPAQVNTYRKFNLKRMSEELRIRRESPVVRGYAEDVEAWWKFVVK